MVEQDSQLAHQILMSQQQIIDSVANCQLPGLASSVAEQWLTSDIMRLRQRESVVYSNVNVKEHKLVDKSTLNNNINKKEESPLSIMVPRTYDSDVLDMVTCDFGDCGYCKFDTNILSPNCDYEQTSPLSLWGSPVDLNNMKMDDVFQVDKADLFQSPTLAELNANQEPLDSFDIFVPVENKMQSTCILPTQLLNYVDCDTKVAYNIDSHIKDKMQSQNGESNANESATLQNTYSHCEKNVRTVNSTQNNEIIVDKTPNSKVCAHEKEFQAVPSNSHHSVSMNFTNSVLPDVTVEHQSSIMPVKNIKTSLGHTNYSKWNNSSIVPSVSNDDYDSQDENTEEEDEEDYDDDDYVFSSDAASGEDAADHLSRKRAASGDQCASLNKKPRYFWQYNIQAKGPKGKLSQNYDIQDVPITDSSTCLIKGTNNPGKVKRDRNDLSPNPLKLYSIGMELQKLNLVINHLTPVNELPLNARPKSRREKNKLASRACRLKKKAQHEANKVKFFGLQKECSYLLHIIHDLKKIIKNNVQSNCSLANSCHEETEALLSEAALIKVAGFTAEFVNSVLEKVAAGDHTGGLNDIHDLCIKYTN